MNSSDKYDRYIIDSTLAIAYQLKADELAASPEFKAYIKALKAEKKNTRRNRLAVFRALFNR